MPAPAGSGSIAIDLQACEASSLPTAATGRSVIYMAQATITYLADDLDGSEADETVRFSLDGKPYEIDLSKKNAAALRKALKPFIAASRSARRSPRRPATARRRAGARGSATAFSKLVAEEKDRFRKWAKLPNARRIADERVQAWIEAGRP